jgi:DNA polymerase III subunit delta
MASISHQDADQFLAGSISDFSIFLVFGADQGLIFERSQKLIRLALGAQGDAMQIVEFAGDAIAADPIILLDEANAINMFGGDVRVIRIAAGNRSLVPALDLIAQTPQTGCVIIIEAGELKRDALLRKWIETRSCAVSVECRADDPKDIQRLIDAEVKFAQLSIDPDAREALGALLGEDRLSTRAELDKLTIYAHGQNAITIGHINEILHDASALGVDAVISAIFSGNSAQVVELAQKALQIGVDINMLVAATLRYALALHRCRADIDNGATFDGALQMLLRQVYGYNRKAEVSNQLRNISLFALEQMIAALFNIVRKTRQNNSLGEQRTIRLFLSLSTLLKKIK